jgi:glycerate 2-kinase
MALDLSTYTLRKYPWGSRVQRVLGAALQAADPAAAVETYLKRRALELEVAGRNYDLDAYRRVFLVGAGKAGAPMSHAAAGILGDRLTQGVVVVKEGYLGSDDLPSRVSILEAGHPIPDERGVQGGCRIQKLLENLRPDDLVIGLISGGGSALLTAPVPGITLNDFQVLTAALLACGATINEINCLRKHLDRLKGGGLARLASPATLITLILSDVVGDPLDVIASGPTVPDPTSYSQAYAVLERYGLLDKVPPSIIAHLESGRRGELPETPKAGDPAFERVQNVIIGSNLQAAQAALHQAEAEGFHTLLLTTYFQGEARQAGVTLAAIARQIAATGQPLARPACLVAGGETTVTLTGSGKGGRNQEIALGALPGLAGLPEIALVSLATDGGDGPTDAAGAVVSGESLSRAQHAGLDPVDYLQRNDAYPFFEALGDLLKPGPTRTNVNDLTFIFAF